MKLFQNTLYDFGGLEQNQRDIRTTDSKPAAKNPVTVGLGFCK